MHRVPSSSNSAASRSFAIFAPLPKLKRIHQCWHERGQVAANDRLRRLQHEAKTGNKKLVL